MNILAIAVEHLDLSTTNLRDLAGKCVL